MRHRDPFWGFALIVLYAAVLPLSAHAQDKALTESLSPLVVDAVIVVKPLTLEGVCDSRGAEITLRGLTATNRGTVQTDIEAYTTQDWLAVNPPGRHSVRPGGVMAFLVTVDCKTLLASTPLGRRTVGEVTVEAPDARAVTKVSVNIATQGQSLR